jgi:hypothetical protein
MANNKLILRTLNSPWIIPTPDFTKNSVLTHADVDNNFIYLKGELIYDGSIVGSDLILQKVNGGNITVDLSGLITSGGTSGDTYVDAAYLSGNTLVLQRNDAVNITVELTGLSADVYYTNSAATPTTIGGIPAGSTFSAQTMQQMWDALLYPYQYPAFTSFARTNVNSVYELGETLIGGVQTFTWATSNSSNVQPNTISIVENHSSTTLVSGSANDGTEALSASTYVRTTPGTTLLYTISAQNTQLSSFSSTISRNWRGRWYYGTDSNTSLTVGIITGGTLNTALTTGVVNSYITWTPSGAEYGYLVIPNYLAQPSDLRDSVAGCFGNNIPFTNQGTITFNNAYGVSQTYNIYRTVNAFNSPVNAWLCS